MNGFEPTLIDLMGPAATSTYRTPLPSSSFESVFTCTSFVLTALKIASNQQDQSQRDTILAKQKRNKDIRLQKRQRIMSTSFSSMSRVLPPPPPSSVAAASAAAATAVSVVSSISSSTTGTNESYYDDGGEEEETEGN